MLQFNFDANKGETPASIAQKRALIAQLMGSARTPSTLGEGFAALGDGIVANVEGGRARDAEAKGQESANSTFGALTSMLTGQGGGSRPTPSYGMGQSSSAQSPQTPASFSGGQQEFISSILPGAIEASQRTGIDPRIIIAQAAHESGWGKHAPGNNLFGIKSHGQPGGQELWTTEEINGQKVRVKDSFRAYENPADSLSGYADFMLENPRYKPLMGAQGLDAQLEALGQSGYATDSTYLNGVGTIARGINLPGMAQSPLEATSALAASAPTQVASLDPSIGAPAQLPPIGPTGGPALTAVSPGELPTSAVPGQFATGPDGNLQSYGSDGKWAPINRLDGSSVQQMQAPPAPVQTAQGPSLQMLMEAAANPWLNDSQKAIINSMIAQQMQQMDPAYLQQMQAGQLGLEKSQLELDAMRNPGKKPPIEVGGVLVDPDTFQPVFDSRQSAASPRPMTPEDRAMWGIPETDTTPYYLDENGQPKPISGGGQTINVGGNNDIGTIPAGMMVTRDAAGNVTGMQAIPGSPAEREAQAAADAAAAGTNQASRYGNVVVEDIDRALDVLAKDPTWSTGMLGQAMGSIKGSNSDRLNNLLDTVRANSAFDRLQAMRDASPTGGALGAVSERELGLLQSAIGSLETGNAEDLAYNLKRLQTIYSEIIDGPKAAAPNQSTPAGDIDDILKGYGL